MVSQRGADKCTTQTVWEEDLEWVLHFGYPMALTPFLMSGIRIQHHHLPLSLLRRQLRCYRDNLKVQGPRGWQWVIQSGKFTSSDSVTLSFLPNFHIQLMAAAGRIDRIKTIDG